MWSASGAYKPFCRVSLLRHNRLPQTAVTRESPMANEFQRVAIVNRGEAAVRFIHAAREFRQEHNVRLLTIALFTEPDRQAMFVREADEAVSLGAAQFTDPETRRPKSS